MAVCFFPFFCDHARLSRVNENVSFLMLRQLNMNAFLLKCSNATLGNIRDEEMFECLFRNNLNNGCVKQEKKYTRFNSVYEHTFSKYFSYFSIPIRGKYIGICLRN